jgi:predicted Zn finger-like uncharacterized protein
MSLVTRCTACGTLFKVVADQLKISDGWVRCGQCGHVFDAQSSLVPDVPTPAAPQKPASVSLPATSPAFTPSITRASIVAAPPLSVAQPAPSPAATPVAIIAPPPSVALPPKPQAPQIPQTPLTAPVPTAVNAAPEATAIESPEPDSDSIEDEIERFRASKISDSGYLAAVLAPSASGASSFGASTFNMPSAPADSRAGESVAPEPFRHSKPPREFSPSLPPRKPLIATLRSFKPGGTREVDSQAQDAGPTTTNWGPSGLASKLSPEAGPGPSPSGLPPELQDSEPIPDSTPGAMMTAPAPLPSFVAQAQSAARWRSPGMRALLSLVALVLLALLAVQLALHQRDALAAMQPQTKPWLQRLCQQMGCQVQAFKHIEAVVLDSSSFNKINKSDSPAEARTPSYRLLITLKNTSSISVALPHIELSLQDSQEQTVLRRVLSPADLGAQKPELAAGQEFSGNAAMQVDVTQIDGQRVSGYRVITFYP